MTLESSKNIGGIGAILLFIGVFPYINYFGIVGLIGAILVLVGLHGLSGYYREPGIFSNVIYGFGAGIVGAVIAAIVGFAVVLVNVTDLIYEIYPGWNGDWSSLQGMTPDVNNIDPTAIFSLLAGLLIVFAIVWIFAIIATFFVRRSLKQVTARSNVGLFGTAGLLLFIGAFLIIIFGLGFILMWIAALILAIAFFTLKPAEPAMATATSPPPPTTI